MWGEVVDLADDGVVVQLELMTVFEDEGGRRLGRAVGGGGISKSLSAEILRAGSTGNGRT